jgi:adenylate cyclase, class 2
MVEVELKYRLHDPEGVLTRLIARGAARRVEAAQVDVYFDHPSRRFGKTDEALRIRWDDQDGLAATYKGPRLDLKSKSREEIEIGLKGGESDLEEAARLLGRLGFREVRRVPKRRTTFLVTMADREIAVSIDDVDGIGLFVELELLADAGAWLTARESLERLALALGLKPEDSERRSYLELLLDRDGSRETTK